VVLVKDGEDHFDHHVRNEEVLLRVNEQGISYMNKVNGRLTGLVAFCVETVFYDRLLKER
jgi:hypothetical protein